MAILKMINVKDAGRKKELEMLDYCSNPQKVMCKIIKPEKDFQKFSWVNRCLQGQKECTRHVKQLVVSLEKTWPVSRLGRVKLSVDLRQVADACEKYFGELGFICQAWVHGNTSHPHMHLIFDTCSAVTGRQFSQSKDDLAEMKKAFSEILIRYGISEKILSSENIEEEKMFSEEQEIIPEKKNFSEMTRWNSGTMEQSNYHVQGNEMMLHSRPLREMCTFVREAQNLPENERTQHGRPLREMCTFVREAQNLPENERTQHGRPLREMCAIVPEAKNISENERTQHGRY